MDTIIFDVNLPTLTDPDVEQRELTVKVGEAEPTVHTVSKSEPKVAGLKAPQGASVLLSLVDIDDAGNRSPASTLTFTATDTVPPAAPGSLSVEITGEE